MGDFLASSRHAPSSSTPPEPESEFRPPASPHKGDREPERGPRRAPPTQARLGRARAKTDDSAPFAAGAAREPSEAPSARELAIGAGFGGSFKGANFTA
jgi:hypothetical protein